MIRFLVATSMIFSILSCRNSTHQPAETTQSWSLLPFKKADTVNPILAPDSTALFFCPLRKQKIRWEEKDVFNPAAVVRHDTIFLLYRAQDLNGSPAGTSRIGLAWSRDGLHFTRYPVPVLYPDNDDEKKYEWEGGCEDPRIVEDDHGIYYLTYTAFDGSKARLMVATSADLYHWRKKGPVFATADKGKYINEWSKSGSIVCTYKTGTPIAVRVNGKYWMYWGDTNIFLASSVDLINWLPVEDNGKPMAAFGPRRNYFDNDLVEAGPPAMIGDSGILLIYNSRHITGKGSIDLPEGTYSASQILFDKNNPSHVLERMDSFFMKPDRPYEINGQVNNVCFVEGLINYNRKWFLYYGTADSKVAVAVKP